MSLWGKIQAKKRDWKYRNRSNQELAEDKLWWDSFWKAISPNRFEIFDTNLLIDQQTYVRCLVTKEYPRDMTSKAIERIQELSFDRCKIMISHGLIQIPQEQAAKDLQDSYFTLNVNQEHAKQVNPGGAIDLNIMCQTEDIVANHRMIHLHSQRSFYSSLIFTIKGNEKEVLTAESYIMSILKSELIDFFVPFGRMFETYLSAMAFPVSESKTWVKVRSDTASILCTSTNLNSRTDDVGLYFGKDLKTNAEIVIDLDTLPAKHLTFLGATGAGKTFSFLLLLMRMHDMQGARIVYTTPKADKGTDYRAVSEYYGDEACIADLGMDSDSNLNPLQIMFDKQSMGTSPFAYKKAYDKHKTIFIKFCKVWFGAEFSSNMESYLDETLNQVYEQFGIYRDRPETWDKPFPVMENIYNIWEKDAENKDLGTKQKTAEALKNKAYHISSKGSLNYINRPTSGIDLSKDFIIIDLSGVPELIQDAMNVLVTGMIHSRFSTDNEKDTIIGVDEAAVYLRNPELSGSMLKTLTQGRSHGVFLWLATHQPSDFAKNRVKEEYKTNMFINIVLGANISNSIGDVKDYFDLTEEEVEILTSCGDDEDTLPGRGLLMVKKQKIPIWFEPTELEEAVIKGRLRKNKPSTDSNYSIKPEYQWLVDSQRMIFKNWVDGDLSVLKSRGYESHRINRIAELGTITAYVPKGMVDEKGMVDLPGIGKMKFIHYAAVVQLAGLLVQLGYENVKVNHNGSVDVEGEITIDGRLFRIGFEIETGNNKDLVGKKERALAEFDIIKFIPTSTKPAVLNPLIAAVGEDYVITQGEQVYNFITNPLMKPSSVDGSMEVTAAA
jgi:hypothetical protein